MKNLTLLFIFISGWITAQELILPTYSDAHHSGANTITETFSFPEDVSNYHKVEMRISLTCPPGGCDPWDRIAWIQLHTDEDTYEIGRYATPYGNDWCSWTIDVSNYRLLLSGEVTLSSYIETWDKGWLLNVDFEFYEGTPEYQHIIVENLWAGEESDPTLSSNDNYYSFLYGEPFFNYNLPVKTISIPSHREKSLVRVVNTGHGQANTNNAAEFSQKTHTLTINDDVSFEHELWNSDCNQNPCSPQGGTWQYSRAGWCPGQDVVPADFDITSSTYVWQHVAIDYVLEEYNNECTPWNINCVDGVTCTSCSFNGSSHTQPNYKIAIQLFHFSNELMESVEVEQAAIQLFPIPASDELQIHIQNSEDVFSIECFNLIGQVVFSSSNQRNSRINISTRNWADGIYSIKFTSQSNTFTQKLIISH